MASFDLAEVVSLAKKANDLHNKGHWERCQEKWRAALTAAEALGAEDCVLSAVISTELARMAFSRENQREGERFSQAVVLEQLELHVAIVATLRRRRDAGTLMEGKCRPAEEQWFMEYLADGPPQDARQAAELRSQAALVGYDAFLAVCCSCMALVWAAMPKGSFERGGDAERAFLSFTCDLLDDAIALMVQPRVFKPGSALELCMLAMFPQMLEVLAHAPEHRLWHVRTAVALARLRWSGVIEKRGLSSDKAARMHAAIQAEMSRAIAECNAAAASGLLKTCALAGCGAREAHVSHFGKCGACKAVVYCCREHQLSDWPAHKADCKAARKAVAAAKDAA